MQKKKKYLKKARRIKVMWTTSDTNFWQSLCKTINIKYGFPNSRLSDEGKERHEILET